MKIHRFFQPNLNITSQNSITTFDQKELTHQILKVLKLRVGELFIIFNGDGTEHLFEIESIGKGLVKARLKDISENQNQPNAHINLYCSILKKENFEWVVQKATELGVSKIVPVITNRTIKQNLKPDRLKQISIEASEQSGRASIPEIVTPLSFNEGLNQAAAEKSLILFCDQDGKFMSDSNLKKQNIISIFIGPEGGWTEQEIDLAKTINANFISFGDLTLRAETAATVAVFAASKL